MIRFAVVAVATLVAMPSFAHAWGRDGHRIVAAIAESRLTPDAHAAVRKILGEDVNLPSISVWADQVRPSRSESAPWHYVDIPLSVGHYTEERCPGGDCVTMIIVRLEEQLGDAANMDPLEAEEALKYLVHFVGDQSQPLHNANEEGDRGGNDKRLTFMERPMNLHSLWDSGLIRYELETRSITPEQLATELNDQIRPESEDRWTEGTPIDWSNESHALARDYVYPSWSPELDELYFRNTWAVARVQLQRGGIRKAHVLNRIFDPAYDGIPEVQRPLVLEENPTEGVRPELPALFTGSEAPAEAVAP